MKYCGSCHTSKPATRDYFYRRKASADGLSYRCIACERRYKREYNARPEIKQRNHDYKKRYLSNPANRGKYNARQREYLRIWRTKTNG